MITFFTVGTFILIITKLYSSIERAKQGLFVSFILIFLFLALRYKYGNDYIGYYDQFKKVNIKNFFSWMPYIEWGWLSLLILFKPFGFFSLVFFLALINCIVYYWFIVRYVDKAYYLFAIFIYYFNSNYLLIQLSAMRQSTAIAIFIIALFYIIQEKYFKSILLLVLATSFHASAILLVPIILLGILIQRKHLNSYWISTFILLFFLLFIFGGLLKPMLGNLVETLFGYRYLIYLDLSNGRPEIVNLTVYTLLIIITLYYFNEFGKGYKLYASLFILGIFIIPISYIIPLSIRLAYYLLPLSIVVYPHLAKLIKPVLTRQIFMLAVVFVILIRLITFLNSSTYGPYYAKYSTVFSTIGK